MEDIFREEDMQMMLSAECHIGTRNSDHQMRPYIWRRRNDGIHVLNIGKTREKLQLAARILVAIENPADVVAISARPYGQRAVLKFAHYTGCRSIAGRFTPGTFTNQNTKQFREPRILIVTDPRTDSQPVMEASYVGIPVIAFCDSDSPLKFVDVAIPVNNKGKHSIGLMYWMLAREVLRLRGSISRINSWDVSVDLFFYREPEEIERAEEAQDAQYEQGEAANWEAAEGVAAPAADASFAVLNQPGGTFADPIEQQAGFQAPMPGFDPTPAPAPTPAAAPTGAPAQTQEQWTGEQAAQQDQQWTGMQQ